MSELPSVRECVWLVVNAARRQGRTRDQVTRDLLFIADPVRHDIIREVIAEEFGEEA